MFVASLVCNVDAECEKLLVCDTELHCVKTLQFDMEEICNFGRFVESAASTGNVSVMYVVDLTTAVYYQKCHDPDCGGYRSPLRPSPIDAIPNPRVSTDSEQISNGIESSN